MPASRLLEDRLALVTGAGSGIGRAIATSYAAAGARVVLVDRDRDACERVVQEIAADAEAGRAWAFALDVTDASACEALVREVGREIGAIDVLVNSAGILVREGIDHAGAHEIARRVMDVNLFGTFNAIQACLPALRATRGCIVNIASGAALRAQRGCAGYSASKGAVKMLTQSMAVDLAKDGIRVNAIAPGVIDTPMTEATRHDPQRLSAFLSRIPLARVGLPEEIAGPAVFLASALASYVNGVTLLVDGGAQA
ncbi:MAG: SDR family oxidoreductase [Burkholderiales bacterium]|nr:SDR family oxidoreductase [Burkholderiales bacterium]MDE2393995.1 SDR family oxidoreductase [Burkholderiales bacterium]MDE2457595.1 SDR family oxidoreductase [Burkholderiales bacterium]